VGVRAQEGWDDGAGAPSEVFREVWRILHQDYLDEPALDSRRLGFEAARGASGALAGPGGVRVKAEADTRRVTYAAIQQMVASLGDPNTRFLPPAERRVETAGYSGRLEGVGACVSLREGQISVDAVVPQGPAARAGVRPGDRLVAVDGRPTGAISVDEVVLRVRGPAGTAVALTMERAAGDRPAELWLEREEIRLVSAWGELIRPGSGLLRIVAFTEHTVEEVGAALEALGRDGTSELVVDVRGNLGGLLEPAIGAASLLVSIDPIAWREDRRGERTAYPWRAERPPTAWPLVVLVDGWTASAAEVLAAAVRDAGRGPLVGMRTYGKGTIQHLYDLSDGSGLHVTAARWVSPAGTPLDRGLTPDVVVSDPPNDRRDPALEQATHILPRGREGVSTATVSRSRYDCGPNSPNAL
jgi:carboxyl-terminal processing protease